MGYIRAEDVLPDELLRRVQEYAEGQLLYIPRQGARRCTWGSVSGTRAWLQSRNARIREERRAGCTTSELAERHYLSEKSIQRILREDAPFESMTKKEGAP
ncbi:MAG: hypothetical protein IJ124_06775 [Clostridia bacterium]|nr:hypothetical protein [Clostridia bacterium]